MLRILILRLCAVICWVRREVFEYDISAMKISDAVEWAAGWLRTYWFTALCMLMLEAVIMKYAGISFR